MFKFIIDQTQLHWSFLIWQDWVIVNIEHPCSSFNTPLINSNKIIILSCNYYIYFLVNVTRTSLNLYLYLYIYYKLMFRFDTCHIYTCSAMLTLISALCKELFIITVMSVHIQSAVCITSVSLIIYFCLKLWAVIYKNI
jgi:hypothetical protein